MFSAKEGHEYANIQLLGKMGGLLAKARNDTSLINRAKKNRTSHSVQCISLNAASVSPSNGAPTTLYALLPISLRLWN
jgi:hypothetical protein